MNSILYHGIFWKRKFCIMHFLHFFIISICNAEPHFNDGANKKFHLLIHHKKFSSTSFYFQSKISRAKYEIVIFSTFSQIYSPSNFSSKQSLPRQLKKCLFTIFIAPLLEKNPSIKSCSLSIQTILEDNRIRQIKSAEEESSQR